MKSQPCYFLRQLPKTYLNIFNDIFALEKNSRLTLLYFLFDFLYIFFILIYNTYQTFIYPNTLTKRKNSNSMPSKSSRLVRS